MSHHAWPLLCIFELSHQKSSLSSYQVQVIVYSPGVLVLARIKAPVSLEVIPTAGGGLGSTTGVGAAGRAEAAG